MNKVSAQIVSTGMEDSPTQVIYLKTNNTLAEVTATGYLSDNLLQRDIGQLSIYQMAVVYTTDQGSVILQVINSSLNVWSLQSSATAGIIAVPTAANQITYATNTDGALAAIGVARVFNAGGIDAGLSGTAGSFRSYGATVTTGYLELFGTPNSGAFNARVTNAALGQTTLYTIPDIGAATGGILVSTTPLRAKIVSAAAAAGGAAAQSFSDAYCTSASIVIGNWVSQANAASVLKIVPGNGSFVVTSSADAGVGTFSYTIYKA